MMTRQELFDSPSRFDAVLQMELCFSASSASTIFPVTWLHMKKGHMIYRVDARRKHVEVRAWGMGESTTIVSKQGMRYDSIDALPEWMQRKIAVLMTHDPTKVTEEIPGLGSHISNDVFWVFGEDGETLGCDTGSEGKGSST